MVRIAEFSYEDGPAPEEEQDTFAWYGKEFRVNPEFSELDFLDFTESATTVDEEDPRAVLLVKKLLQSQIHPDDFQEFWDHSKKAVRRRGEGGQLHQLMRLTQVLMEAFAGRPTEQPSGSPSGQHATVTTLKDVSSYTEHTPEGTTSTLSPKVARVMAAVGAGRPDLGQVVLHAAEARSAVPHAG